MEKSFLHCCNNRKEELVGTAQEEALGKVLGDVSSSSSFSSLKQQQQSNRAGILA